MSDNKQNVGEPDRSRVSRSEEYEDRYFADKQKISLGQARHLLAKRGNQRDMLNREAEKLKHT